MAEKTKKMTTLYTALGMLSVVVSTVAIGMLSVFTSSMPLTLCTPVIDPVTMYDGDTAKGVLLSLDFDTVAVRDVRVLGIQSPEIRTRDSEEKRRGFLAKDAAQAWVDAQPQLVLLSAVKGSGRTRKGKYGRVLGDFAATCDGPRLSKYMLESGHAEKYK
jgi:hypothetical protein